MDYLSRYNVSDFLKTNNSIALLSSTLQAPKISIVTASYNQGHFLERTILSVINQNYPNFELIIIDGGSTDNSLEIIKKYEKYISYWVSEKDNGQTEAINKGLKIATGDLLCFQNSDDVFYQNAFQIVSEFYKINPNFDGYYGDQLFIDANDNVIEILKTNQFDIKAQVLEGMQIFNQSFFFKKKNLQQFGYLDENLNFVLDYENVLRWAYKGAKFAKVKKLIGAFRMHDGAKTSNLENIRKTEHESVRNKYFELMFQNKKLTRLQYLRLRINKLFYFIGQFDFEYIYYRNKLKNET